MAAIEVLVPDIGDFKDVPVIELLVKPGDTVAAEESLVVLESDKATMEVPAPRAGVVKEVKVKVGDRVRQGSLIVLLEAAASAAVPAPSQPAAPAPAAAAPEAPKPASPAPARVEAPAPAIAVAPAPLPATGVPPHASPGVRRFARELGVDRKSVV